jgi:hypothetical protein
MCLVESGGRGKFPKSDTVRNVRLLRVAGAEPKKGAEWVLCSENISI